MPSRAKQTCVSARMVDEETTPLLRDSVLPNNVSAEAESNKSPTWEVVSVLSVLLIGVFIANVDMTLLLATYSEISSEFGALTYGSWLLTAYMLSMCAWQPLYGKLSSIFGIKPMLLVSYTLYASGSAICSLGQSMPQVIAGRVVAGAGGAGMVCLVSILITDLVPLRQVAQYRSYVNVVQTIGRSVGGPVGGAITDTWGWRMGFAALCPSTIVAILLVSWKLDGKRPKSRVSSTCEDHCSIEEPGYWERMKTVDIPGCFGLAGTITTTLLIFTVGGTMLPWTHPLVIAMIVGSTLGWVGFYTWETYYARDPIFPPSILGYQAVWTSYLLLLLQNAAQAAATLSVPLFFQITLRTSTAEAGAYLLPSVVGNTIGGLGTGFYIKATGRYKLMAVVAGMLGILGYSLMLCRWDNNSAFNPLLEDWYLVFAGLATGIAHSVAFVVLSAGISALDMKDDDETSTNVAIAGSGLYLSGNVGAVVGLCLSSTILRVVLQRKLSLSLDPETVRKAMQSNRVSYDASL